MTRKIFKIATIALLLFPAMAFSQLNSPYSRYGVGNLITQGNISNRAMGGIGAAIADPLTQNTLNPASYSSLYYTTLDFGLEYNGMNLKSKVPVESFKSNYAMFSYLNVGVPLLTGNKKAVSKNINWAMSFGLKPESKINYKVTASERTSFDSLTYIYEGQGGINKAYFGSAFKVKGFSLGFNTGYLFGEKNYSTQLSFNNDSLLYYKSNHNTKSQFGGMFLDLGLQQQIKVSLNSRLRFGTYTNLKSKYTARRDHVVETFNYDEYDGVNRIDSIFETAGERGKIILPGTYGFGVAFENENLLVGADYETTSWSDYRFFGQADPTQNSWTARAGFQYYPATISSTSYFNFIRYRAGFFIGKDYINVDNDLPIYGFSVGGSLPLRLRRSFYDRQISMMNVTFEYASRGNKNNNITESLYKLSVGFSLSDVWFIRQKYQ